MASKRKRRISAKIWGIGSGRQSFWDGGMVNVGLVFEGGVLNWDSCQALPWMTTAKAMGVASEWF